MDAHIVWNPQFMRNIEESFGNGGKLQKFIDMTILESAHPYLPFDSGALAASGKNHTTIGSGKLVWKTPYARYLYYGMLMVDPKTGSSWARKHVKKVKTDTPLKFQGGGKRGAFWCERWKRDNLVTFQNDLQKEANRLLQR